MVRMTTPDDPRRYLRGVLIGIGRVVEIRARTPEDLEEATRLMTQHRDEPQPGVGPAFEEPAPAMPSMRDLFAGQALQAFLGYEHWRDAKDDAVTTGDPLCDITARWAYAFADAMLAERAKAKP